MVYTGTVTLRMEKSVCGLHWDRHTEDGEVCGLSVVYTGTVTLRMEKSVCGLHWDRHTEDGEVCLWSTLGPPH